MSTVILEIGVEEIPADYLAPAANNIRENLEKQLVDKRIKAGKISVYYTVRRFIAYLEGVDERQADLSYSRKGPAQEMIYSGGTLTDMGKNFLAKNNIKESEIQYKEEKGKKYVFIEGVEKGRPCSDVLKEVFPAIISGIKFPKSMTWDDGGVSFARPIRWILALKDKEIIDFKFGKISAGNKTRLHKFIHDNKEETVKNAEGYFDVMKKHGIEVIPQERMEKTAESAVKELKKRNLAMIEDKELMRRVADSIETVSVMTGEFDKRFLFLPEQVIITAMREHQRYFAVTESCGKFTNVFVNIRDGGTENNAYISRQHSKVLLSRLSDAEFFYNEDLKRPLEENVPRLKDSVFIAGLGTMYDKARRLESFVVKAKGIFSGADAGVLKDAALLCKADLCTNMVEEKEFVSLRGFMGGVYLKAQGRDERLCRAVSEHYLPNFAGDALPSTPEGVFISLADKLDNMSGFYAAGFKPTGSKDPYAVRRQAMTIIYMILEKQLGLDVKELLEITAEGYKSSLGKGPDVAEMAEFFRAREMNYFKEKGIDYDIVAAVCAGTKIDLLSDMKKCAMILEKRKAGRFNDTVFAVSRLGNILPRGFAGGSVNEALLEAGEEKALYAAFKEGQNGFKAAVASGEHENAYNFIEKLGSLISSFFDKVLVMAGDDRVKNNRLSMIKEIYEALLMFADFSKIVVDREKK